MSICWTCLALHRFPCRLGPGPSQLPRRRPPSPLTTWLMSSTPVMWKKHAFRRKARPVCVLTQKPFGRRIFWNDHTLHGYGPILFLFNMDMFVLFFFWGTAIQCIFSKLMIQSSIFPFSTSSCWGFPLFGWARLPPSNVPGGLAAQDQACRYRGNTGEPFVAGSFFVLQVCCLNFQLGN